MGNLTRTEQERRQGLTNQAYTSLERRAGHSHDDVRLTKEPRDANDAVGRPVERGAGTSTTAAQIVMTRVFPQPGQIGLFIAAADGSNERPLVSPADLDYDATWAPDGASIVFTSERNGSADLYRVKADGSGLERLTDSPAYDDQAAFSPDGRQLVFVTTRAGGTADLWTMDLQTRMAKALTSGPGGDFRPSWSPDGQWIAFSSDRRAACRSPMDAGNIFSSPTSTSCVPTGRA